MFGFIKKMFIALLTSLDNASIHAKCVSLSIQKCEIQPLLLIYILINTVNSYTTVHLQLI